MARTTTLDAHTSKMLSIKAVMKLIYRISRTFTQEKSLRINTGLFHLSKLKFCRSHRSTNKPETH